MEPSETISVSNIAEDHKLGFLPPLSSPAQPNPSPNIHLTPSDAPAEKNLDEALQNLSLKENEQVEKDKGSEENGEGDEEGDEDEEKKASDENDRGDEHDDVEKEEETEDLGETENENVEEEKLVRGENEEDEKEEWNNFHFPIRTDADDCSYYLRTGTCKFGPNCRFNHPRRKTQEGTKEKMTRGEDTVERMGQMECKYYLKAGGCKFGKTCRYNHTRWRTPEVHAVEYNFVGLPIRPGERECPYYMRNGSCKYATNCRFNHPDPTSGCDPSTGYGNDGSLSLRTMSQPTIASWSFSRTLNGTAPLLPMMYSPSQGIPTNPDWNGYQASLYAPERTSHLCPAYVINNKATETNIYAHQQQMLLEEFPERPGQAECSYFLKTGDCKFKSNCKFHHPRDRNPKSISCAVTDKGLPLRPDQNVCTHYSRYGICKFGPNCKFDHPVNRGHMIPTVFSGPRQPPFSNHAVAN